MLLNKGYLAKNTVVTPEVNHRTLHSPSIQLFQIIFCVECAMQEYFEAMLFAKNMASSLCGLLEMLNYPKQSWGKRGSLLFTTSKKNRYPPRKLKGFPSSSWPLRGVKSAPQGSLGGGGGWQIYCPSPKDGANGVS